MDFVDKDLIRENLGKFEEGLDKMANLTKAKFTRRIKREDTALIIVDVQEKLAPAMNKKEEAIKNTQVLIEMANTLGMKIIVTEQYPRGLGSSLEEIREGLGADARVFEKISFSAYEDREIRDYIESLNIANFIVLGMETHICVYQTARDLLLKGYNVYIPLDGVASRTSQNHKNGLDLIRDYGGKISNTETILFDLLSRAGTDEFKKLSPLIK